jgi:glycerophosphoryl diester phosphodiesterase
MAWMQILISLTQLSFATEVHGHRGSRSVFPENTLVAFDYALSNGADYIEVDTHMTKDNEIVIHHDSSINRLICLMANGRPIQRTYTIKKLTLNEIKSFDCGTLTLREFPRQQSVPGERVPTLQEVIDLFKHHLESKPYIKLNIEIKFERNSNYPALEPYVDKILDLVRDNKLEEHIIYQSFSKDVVKHLEDVDPNHITYLLSASPFANYQRVLEDTGADGLSIYHSWINENLVNTVRTMNRKILSWTANKKSEWRKLLNLGVDGIITDDPAGLYEYKREEAN